jgi:hypothetical protein
MTAIALKIFCESGQQTRIDTISFGNVKKCYLDYSVAKFYVPNWGDKVNSGIGLSYRPAGLYRPVLQINAGDNFTPQSGTMKLATDFQCWNFKTFYGG